MSADLKQKLAELKAMFEEKLIDEAEYREEKKALFSSSRPSGGPPPQSSGAPQGTVLSLAEGMTIGADNNRLFRLIKKLGGGAMGEVWKAEDIAESKIVGHEALVAVKTLIPFLSAGERHREALKREAINAKKLRHRHIIGIHDWYEDKVGGFPFIVMEYLEGQTLDQKLAHAGHYSYAETLDILKPIAEALSYAWEEHRIVHRDIKPDNIYLTVDGKLKLLDFGIAAQARDTATSAGLSGFDSPGTLGYAPPEAGANQKANPRLDLYALGVLTYELLEGKLPFIGQRNREHWPDKPDALNEAQWQVLRKAMAYDTQDRYDSAGNYLSELQRAEGSSAEEIEEQKREAAAQAAEEQAKRKAEEERTRQQAKEREEQEAEERHEVALWQGARKQDTLEAYQEYLDKSKRKIYQQSAQERIVELRDKARQEAGEQAEKAAREKAEAERREAERKDEEACKVAREAEAEQARVRRIAEESARQSSANRSAPSAPTQTSSGKKFPVGLMVGIVAIAGVLIVIIKPGKQELASTSAASSAPAAAPIPAPAAAPAAVSPASAIAAKPASQATGYRTGQTFNDCPECPEMVVIPAGSFDMGTPGSEDDDEGPIHRVTLSREFAMGKTEVTQGQWKAVMGNNPSRFSDCGDTCPVENVSWNDAKEFIQKLNAKTGKQYRLLSEAEWEYACRAGTTTEYYWGNSEADIGKYAVYEGNSNGKTAEVGSKRPNPWGLYDMSGNVWEWVEDSWHNNYQGAPTDGSAWKGDHAERVLRGGSRDFTSILGRAAARSWGKPATRSSGYGFRLARTLP